MNLFSLRHNISNCSPLFEARLALLLSKANEQEISRVCSSLRGPETNRKSLLEMLAARGKSSYISPSLYHHTSILGCGLDSPLQITVTKISVSPFQMCGQVKYRMFSSLKMFRVVKCIAMNVILHQGSLEYSQTGS